MSLKSQSSLLVRTDSLDYAKGKLDVRFQQEDPESEEMKDLVENIRSLGIMNPLHIVPKSGGRFEVVSGNRRLVAAKALRLQYVPANIIPYNAAKARRMGYADNEARLNTNVMQKAKGLLRIYEDIGIPGNIAIMKVKHMHNLKMNHPEEYKQLSSAPAKNYDNTNAGPADPTREFLDAFKDIPFSANTQYQLLQTVVKIPTATLEILGKAPRLGMDKAVTLANPKLKAYPEVVRESLAEKIIDPNVNADKARHLVNQTLADLEEGRTTVTKEGNISYGYGSGQGYRSDPEENVDTEQELEKTFDVELLDITSVLMKTIAKCLHIQITKGSNHFNPSQYKPAIEQLQKKLETLKKDEKIFCAEQAAIMGRICKAIVDSAR